MNRVFIIAEAGVNHNGSLKTARSLIDKACDAGCDAVKFQTFNAEKLVTISAPKAGYQIKNSGNSDSQYSMLKALELSIDDYVKLAAHCLKRGIIFMSTPFDEESADFLDGLGMAIFKIPSGEITNKPLIRHIAAKCKPIILSTGMSDMKEVRDAIHWIGDVWKSAAIKRKPVLTLLHCVSNYPSSPEEMNLRAMASLSSAFHLPVGLSDHTLGIEVAIAAVGMGGSMIEKHFTLDRMMEGPDHKASLEPDELETMTKAIRNIEKALGHGVKTPTISELKNIRVMRKSIVAASDIKRGEKLTEINITSKRPGTGLSPILWDSVVGRSAVRDFKKDEFIKI